MTSSTAVDQITTTSAADCESAQCQDTVAALAQTRNELARVGAELAAERDRADNLLQALETSRTIGAAVGVLMAQHKITADAAFDLLRQASQRLHRKLREIALEVTETGRLDDLAGR